jgi:hypothetical protein
MTTDEFNDLLRMYADRPLTQGTHRDVEDGWCLLEKHSVRRGGPFTDAPQDVSPPLRSFGVVLNDQLLSEGPYRRIELEPRLAALEPLLTDTAGNAVADRTRSLMALDWLIRSYLPAFLRLVPSLREHADGLAALASLLEDGTNYLAIGEQVRAARAAAGAAAWDALKPTVTALQDEAIRLFERMIATR